MVSYYTRINELSLEFYVISILSIVGTFELVISSYSICNVGVCLNTVHIRVDISSNKRRGRRRRCVLCGCGGSPEQGLKPARQRIPYT